LPSALLPARLSAVPHTGEQSSAGMDAHQVATLVKQEAQPSLGKALRVIAKLITVTFLGFALSSRCTFGLLCLTGSAQQLLMPAGVVVLAITAGWVDVIRYECSCCRFFPWKSLNTIGALLFRWQFGLVAATIFLALISAWSAIKFAVLPLMLMQVVRFIEPFHFRRAREDVRRSGNLLQQLLSIKKSTSMSEFLDVDRIPLYKLGSVAKLLNTLAADFGATDKLTVHIEQAATVESMSPLSVLFAPFRFVAGEVFLWEERDCWLYMALVMYLALVYIGSYHLWFAPLCIAFPLLGPKSRAGRYLRALQEDLRLEQGKMVEKKGGMVPKETSELEVSINWPMLIYVTGTHVAALWGLVVLVFFKGICPLLGNGKAMKRETCAFAVVMYVMSGLGITAGVHRLWSHRSYKAALPVRMLLMIFNSMANQGTIVHWARDHRTHHLYSDTIADPHDANRGFWFSHVGWLITKKRREVYEAGKEVNMNDIYADPVPMLQKSMDPFWNLAWCFAFPSFMSLVWGDSLWNGFLLGGVLRYTFVLNATWAVNSVVHNWGPKPYNASHRTTENGWVSLFAFGEGWHNWHHAFPWDYAAAELEPHLQFNLTKVFIDFLALLGLVWDRKRGDKVWATRKARWAEKFGRQVVEGLEGPPVFKRRVVTFGPQEYGHEDEPDDSPAVNLAAGTKENYVPEAVGSVGRPVKRCRTGSDSSVISS